MAKPKFNPKAEFEPVEAVKPKFDPSKKFDLVQEDKEPEGPSGQEKALATLSGIGQGIALGYAPQLQAKLEPLTDRFFNLFQEKGKEVEPAPISQLYSNDENYVKSRDQAIAQNEKYAKESPGYYYGGEIGGGLLQAAATPALGGGEALSAAGKAAPFLSKANALATGARLGQAAAIGGGLGLISNPGDQEGKVDVLQGEDRFRKGMQGAVTGGLMQGAGEVVGQGITRGVPALADKLKTLAGRRAAKALGPSGKDFRSKQQIDDTGRILLEEGVISKMPKSYEKVAETAGEKADVIGKKLDQAIKAVSEANPDAGIDRSTMLQHIENELVAPNIMDGKVIPGSEPEIKVAQDFASLFKEGEGPIGLKEAQALKEKIGSKINWKRRMGEDIPPREQAYRAVYKKLQTGIEDAAADAAGVGGEQARDAFIDLKKRYGALTQARDIANKKSLNEFKNRTFSLTDYQAGIGGALVGAMSGDDPETRLKNAALYGAGGALLNEGARRHASQLVGKGLYEAGNLIGSTPKSIQKAAGLLGSNPKGLILGTKGLLNRSENKDKEGRPK